MAKKRKASSYVDKPQRDPEEVNAANAKVRIDTYEDVADSEDEFHINRDKILLDEGRAVKRRRQIQEQG